MADDAGSTFGVIRPVHPSEDSAIELLEPSLTDVFKFIRERDADNGPASSKRKYTKSDWDGDSVCNMGMGRTATVAKGSRRSAYIHTSTEALEGGANEEGDDQNQHDGDDSEPGDGAEI